MLASACSSSDLRQWFCGGFFLCVCSMARQAWMCTIQPWPAFFLATVYVRLFLKLQDIATTLFPQFCGCFLSSRWPIWSALLYQYITWCQGWCSSVLLGLFSMFDCWHDSKTDGYQWLWNMFFFLFVQGLMNISGIEFVCLYLARAGWSNCSPASICVWLDRVQP